MLHWGPTMAAAFLTMRLCVRGGACGKVFQGQAQQHTVSPGAQGPERQHVQALRRYGHPPPLAAPGLHCASPLDRLLATRPCGSPAWTATWVWPTPPPCAWPALPETRPSHKGAWWTGTRMGRRRASSGVCTGHRGAHTRVSMSGELCYGAGRHCAVGTAREAEPWGRSP